MHNEKLPARPHVKVANRYSQKDHMLDSNGACTSGLASPVFAWGRTCACRTMPWRPRPEQREPRADENILLHNEEPLA